MTETPNINSQNSKSVLDYIGFENINGRKYIIYICHKHGMIKQRDDVHQKSKKCCKCSKEKVGQFDKKTILELAKNDYDYLIEDKIYKSKDFIKISCKEHGIFIQKLHNHFYLNQRCPKCAKVKNINITEDTLNKLNGLKILEYKGYRKKSKLECKKHGEFSMNIESAKKSGCLKCSKEDRLNNQRLEFINKSKLVWSNLIDFDYAKLNYKGSLKKMRIFSNETGWISQLPYNHLKGFVPKTSTGEKLIEVYLNNNKISFIKQKKFEKCKNIKCLRFDFYLPSKNLCIEFNGIQHYEPIKNWGGEKKLIYQKNNDHIKMKFCEENEIKLIIISHKDSILEKLKDLC